MRTIDDKTLLNAATQAVSSKVNCTHTTAYDIAVEIINLVALYDKSYTFDKYIMDAYRTAPTEPRLIDLEMVHGAIGISTEAGELLDAIKKYLFYNKPIDLVNVLEELGDLHWYESTTLQKSRSNTGRCS